MATNILNSSAPNLVGQPSPEFVRPDFDAAVWLKGYKIIIERALRCPCNNDTPLPNCQNCQGTGYFYINPLKTIGLITGINTNTATKSWSEELLGTIALTIRDDDKVNFSYYDRVTMLDLYAYWSERKTVRRSLDGSFLFVFTTYKPKDILSIHSFVNINSKLNLLSPTRYHVSEENEYCVILSDASVQEGDNISIYYGHAPEYHILDLPHEIRSSWKKNKQSGELYRIDLPRQAVARRTHFIDAPRADFDGSGVVKNDNS